jgi:phospholipid N-methyltransferase
MSGIDKKSQSGFDETMQYVKSFMKDAKVASVTPTSGGAVRQICDRIDFSTDVHIIEYGAGSGVFTDEILARMSAGSTLLAFETNADLAAELSKVSDPRLTVICESAELILDVQARMGLPQADYILSGIPFSFLKPKQRRDVIIHSRDALKIGGRFIVYQASWAMKATIKKVFGNCETDSALINLPPLFVMDARKESVGN